MTKTATLIAGMDIGDRFSYLHVLDSEGEVLEETRVPTTPQGLRQGFESRPPLRIAIEVGTHSPWISRLLHNLGHDVLVANPRQLRLIHSSTRKNDRLDAERLARLLRLDPSLLSPVEHRDEEAQAALALVRARSALVSARTKLVNHARGAAKSRGHRLPSSSTAAFPRHLTELPDELRQSLEPVGACITQLSIEIRSYDTRIKELSAERYPETELLRQVAGVGPVTALVFRLVVQHPARFPRGRQVGAYLGLVPRQDQSGGSDRQLRITAASINKCPESEPEIGLHALSKTPALSGTRRDPWRFGPGPRRHLRSQPKSCLSRLQSRRRARLYRLQSPQSPSADAEHPRLRWRSGCSQWRPSKQA